MVRSTDRPAMTIAVDLGRKATKQPNQTSACFCRTSENCKSVVLQDKCNIEIFLCPEQCHDFLQQGPVVSHTVKPV